jgi:hypothetical protein
MLTTVNPQPSLWEAILPEIVLGMPAGLASVDALLDGYDWDRSLLDGNGGAEI